MLLGRSTGNISPLVLMDTLLSFPSLSSCLPSSLVYRPPSVVYSFSLSPCSLFSTLPMRPSFFLFFSTSLFRMRSIHIYPTLYYSTLILLALTSAVPLFTSALFSSLLLSFPLFVGQEHHPVGTCFVAVVEPGSESQGVSRLSYTVLHHTLLAV